MQKTIEIETLIRGYIDLQKDLIVGVKDVVDAEDWQYLTDVPSSGSVLRDGKIWNYQVHGTGILFKSGNVIVDANSYLDLKPCIFDTGRLVDFALSLEFERVEWAGQSFPLDYHEMRKIIGLLCQKDIVREYPSAERNLYLLVD